MSKKITNATKIFMVFVTLLVTLCLSFGICGVVNAEEQVVETRSMSTEQDEVVPYFFNSYTETITLGKTKFKVSIDPKDYLNDYKKDKCIIKVTNKSGDGVLAYLSGTVSFRYDAGNTDKTIEGCGTSVTQEILSYRGDIRYVEVKLTVTANGISKKISKSFGKW